MKYLSDIVSVRTIHEIYPDIVSVRTIHEISLQHHIRNVIIEIYLESRICTHHLVVRSHICTHCSLFLGVSTQSK